MATPPVPAPPAPLAQRPPLPPRRRAQNPGMQSAMYTASPAAMLSMPPPRYTGVRPTPYYSVPIPVANRRTRPTKVKAKEDDFFDDLFKSIKTALSNEVVVLSVVIVVALVSLHVTDPDSGPIGNMISKLKKGSYKNIGDFLETHIKKLLGVLIFIPVIYPIRKDQKLYIILFTAFWILITPASSPLIYFLQAMTLYLYLKLRKSSHKVVIVIIGGVLYTLLSPLNLGSSPLPTG